jgi:hypothetical protein
VASVRSSERQDPGSRRRAELVEDAREARPEHELEHVLLAREQLEHARRVKSTTDSASSRGSAPGRSSAQATSTVRRSASARRLSSANASGSAICRGV